MLAFVALAALIVVAPATGAKPTRTVVHLEGGFLIPAGQGCSFDVRGESSERARQTFTEFSDGRIVTIGHAEPTLINLDTGNSFVQRSRYKATETFDPETNELFVEISGRFFINLFEGDQGPSGEVEEPGELLSVIGHQQFTVDPDTGVITSYSLDGRATDLCSLLSG
jgi:hypothetical protein